VDKPKNIIPFQSIIQSLNLYKQVHAPLPSFGMDIFKKNFKPDGIALVANNGEGNKGIPIRCDHYIIVLCKNGHAHRRLNHHHFQINKYSAHFILPGQIHSFSNSSNDFEIFVLLFERSYLSKLNLPAPLLDNLLQTDPNCSPNIQLSKEEFTNWYLNLQQINTELKEKKPLNQEIVSTSILHLLFQLKRKTLHQINSLANSNKSNRILFNFKNHIEQYFEIKKTVLEYAELLHITPKHLSETVKTLTNQTALYHIHERIIHEAEYLLVYTDSSISEISFQLNFDTPSHFGRFFKKHKNITPLVYRKNHL